MIKSICLQIIKFCAVIHMYMILIYKEKFISKQKVDTSRSISSVSWILKRFWSAAFLKPFLCIGMTLIISNLTGFEVINLYMVPILQESGSNIDAEIGTIIVGGVRVLSAGK